MATTRAQDTLINISEFAGHYPNIPLPPDMLREFGEDALFVTLPIGKVGARSRNGRNYTRQAVQAIVDAVNTQRPEGRWGHLRDEERGTRYDPPAIRWLAAMMDGNGMAWAKGIPVTAEAREHFRIAKIAGSRVGTSVYGYGQMEGEDVVAFELETIDLADPNRVGIPDTAAHPMITSEQADDDKEGEEIMPEITLNDVPEAVRQQILEQHNQAQNSERISEMQTQITELQGQVTTLTTERNAARGEASKLLVTYAKATIAEQVQIEGVRKLVERMVGIREQENGAVIEGVNTVAELDAAIKSVLEDEAIKEFNKETLKEMMGPNLNPPMRGKQSDSKAVLGDVIPG